MADTNSLDEVTEPMDLWFDLAMLRSLRKLESLKSNSDRSLRRSMSLCEAKNFRRHKLVNKEGLLPLNLTSNPLSPPGHEFWLRKSDESSRIPNMVQRLHRRFIGQNEVTIAIVWEIQRPCAGLKNPNHTI
ncbi:hypothetical protein HID58_056863 [Brassica napus]|uniref:Uncharacterized protein n=1 Tax=Brassica napus TaxID=3708 RepID=A0ABQ8APF7_BRANA|nr:hypothetical protein HID58_056863 [Brassica napus]